MLEDANQLLLGLEEVNQSSPHLGGVYDVSPVLESVNNVSLRF